MRSLKLKFALFLSLVLGAAPAFADTCAKNLTGLFTSFQARQLCDTFVGTATISGSLTFTGTGPVIAPTALAVSVGAASTPNYTINNIGVSGPSSMQLSASTAIPISAGAASTPNMMLDVNGVNLLVNTQQVIGSAAFVVTPATDLTPVAAARFSKQINAIATAAPTAAYMFAQPTASVGKEFKVYNQGASPLSIIPEDGTINVTGALTPFACATQKECKCRGYSATQMICTAD